MDRVIRQEDGTLISTLEWNAIKASARLLKHELRLLPTPADRRAQIQPKTKVYYKTYYPREWSHAVQRLEEEQPLLRLCSSHWKAEHVLNNTLMNGRHNDNDGNSDDSDDSAKKQKPVAPRRMHKKSRTDMQVDSDDGTVIGKHLTHFYHIHA
jgi:hypothetical protein